jgi:hypothetical protein
MQGEHVPQEDRDLDFLKHPPDYGSSALANWLTNGRPDNIDAPTAGVSLHMEVVGQSQTRPSASTIAKVAAYPD